MKNLRPKQILSAALAAALTLLPLQALAAPKSEIVYAALSASGTTQAVYVVNKFDLTQAQAISDYGNYTKILNLTSLAPLQMDGDRVTAQAEAGTFYYQGQLTSTDIPWQFSLRYRLDGREIEPGSLGGKSGRLEMTIDIQKNSLVNETYFQNYALQFQVKLDGDLCKNIKADGATQANQGSQVLLTYMVLPDTEKCFELSADVHDFTLESFTASGLPLNMDVDSIDTAEFKDKISDLQGGIDALDDGASALKRATGKLNKGATTLSGGAADIAEGVASLASGADQLADRSGGVMAGLRNLASGLKEQGSSASRLKEAGQQLIAGSGQLRDGLSALGAQLDALIASAETMKDAIGALKSAAGVVSGDISNLRNLIGVVSDYPDIASKYAKYISSARNVIGAMESLENGLDTLYGNFSGFSDALVQVRGAVTSLEAASESLYEGQSAYVGPATQLAEGINALGAADTVGGAADQYAAFDAAVQQLSTGLNQLQTSYDALKAGVDKLDKSAGLLNKGAGKLESGTGTLKSETGDMDQQIDEEVDKVLEKFKNEDFAPVSFVDPRNEVSLVQFTMKFDAIEAPEPVKAPAEIVAEDTSFWGKVMKIYQGLRSGK